MLKIKKKILIIGFGLTFGDMGGFKNMRFCSGWCQEVGVVLSLGILYLFVYLLRCI